MIRLFKDKAWGLPLTVFMILVIVVIAGVVLSLLFSGCASQGRTQGTYEQEDTSVRQGASSGDFTEHTITLGDGRSVTCLTWSSWDIINDVMKSGMDCLEPSPE